MSALSTSRHGRAAAPGAAPATFRGRRGKRSLTGLLVAAHLVCGSAAARAQSATLPADTARPDSLRLATLTARAVARDPRGAQRALQAERAALELRTIAREALPTLAGSGQAQYQSQVTRLPIELPPAVTGGRPFPLPPNDTYDASVRAELALRDPTRAPRRAARRAQLAEAEAQVGADAVRRAPAGHADVLRARHARRPARDAGDEPARPRGAPRRGDPPRARRRRPAE
jgi:hypothetical protein